MDYIKINTPKPEVCLDCSIHGNAEVFLAYRAYTVQREIWISNIEFYAI